LNALNGQTGIYAFVHIPTGTSYIGSSIDLGGRIMDHILGNSSNPHLQNAFLKYGLSHYAFVILEYCLSSNQLKRDLFNSTFWIYYLLYPWSFDII